MTYTIKQYAIIRFQLDGQTYAETVPADDKSLTAKLTELADTYGALEFKVEHKYILVPDGEAEPEQVVGVVGSD